MNYETDPSFPEFLKEVRFHTPPVKKFTDEIQKRIGGASDEDERKTLEKYRGRGIELAGEHVSLHELKIREDELRKRMDKRKQFFQKKNCPGAYLSDSKYLDLVEQFNAIGMDPKTQLFNSFRTLQDSFPLLRQGAHFWQH